MPPPTLDFEGISSDDNFTVFAGHVVPPDPNGDVGPRHYVEMVNLLVRVFDKAGNPLTDAFKMSDLFAALGGVCALRDKGDPIVLYDPLADRWLLSEFGTEEDAAHNLVPPFYECVAISQTGDPSGAYFVYAFPMPGQKFNDYPKWGVWPDGYYMTANQFDAALTTFEGTGVFGFDRLKMLRGDSLVTFVYFDLAHVDPSIGGMLPSDLDGIPPPVGRPNTFAYFTADEFGDPQDGVRLFDFHVDFAVPNRSTFTERPESPLAVAPFDPSHPDPNGFADIPQPPPGVNLDALSDRLLHRLQYRNFGTHESLVVDHTVAASTNPYQAGVRYYELRRPLPGGLFTVAEQATFAPADGTNRWMGSAAMDHQGDLAVGYSVSSNSVFPSIRYAGRLASDPPNGLAQGEATLIAGSGSQTSDTSRWGDYSMLAVDPVDDCTFWYTNEYYAVTSDRGWQTRIGTFSFPGCVAPPRGGLAVRVTDCTTGTPLLGASVETSNGYFAITDATGTAFFAAMNPDTYAVVGSKPFFDTAQGSVTVTDGGTAHLALCLSVMSPAPVLSSNSVVAEILMLIAVGAGSLRRVRARRGETHPRS